MIFLPGWHSIESTTWIHDLFEKSSFILLCVLAVAIGLAYIYGHRRDYLADEAIQDAARRAAIAERQAAIAEGQAANSERQTPVAGRQVETTEGRAANLDEQEPTAERHAAVVEMPAATAERRVAIAERQAANAERQAVNSERQPPVAERQAGTAEGHPANPEEHKSTAERYAAVVEMPVAEARRQPPQDDRDRQSAGATAPPKGPLAEPMSAPENERKKSNDISTPRTPRHLAENQKTRLRDFLARQPKGRLTIRINPSVPDASNYGVEIAQFLKREAGWLVRIDSSTFKGPDHGGMWVTLRSADAIPEFTGTLHAALAHAHIPVRDRPVWDPNGPGLNEIWLVIGKAN